MAEPDRVMQYAMPRSPIGATFVIPKRAARTRSNRTSELRPNMAARNRSKGGSEWPSQRWLHMGEP